MLGIVLFAVAFLATIAGSTLAFIVSEASGTGRINLSSNKFSVVFNTEGPINGNLTLGTSKEEGLTTGVSLKMADDSVLAKASLYINVDNISNNKIINNTTSWKKALIWELYGYDENDNQELISTGNFLQCSTTGQKECSNGDKLYMYKNFQLTHEYVYFDVYVWLDGNLADNGAKGATLSSTVSAETEDFTAELQ